VLLFPLNLNNSFSFKSLTFFSEPHHRKAHKIKGDANPYAPEWNAYFEEREINAQSTNLSLTKSILNSYGINRMEFVRFVKEK